MTQQVTMTTLDLQQRSSELFAAAMRRHDDVCATLAPVSCFPDMLSSPLLLDCIGVMVCLEGELRFTVDDRDYVVGPCHTVMLPTGSTFGVGEALPGLRVALLFYRADSIRDMLGSTVVAMRVYALLAPGQCRVWQTGEEADLSRYISLIAGTRCDSQRASIYGDHESKLLLMAFTYRLCDIFTRNIVHDNAAIGRKLEVFVSLVRLVEQHFTTQRSVSFYADRLCLSPKYLSALVKSVCGYTVQEIVFKAIIRRSIFLMKNTNMTVQQISDEMHFPNASAFGTFFKRNTGLSPRHYRNAR